MSDLMVTKDNKAKKQYGLLAQFKSSGALLEAAKKMCEAGFSDYDCHSPFPIHGMDKAMGLKRSPVGYIAGAFGMMGLAGGFALQIWTSSVDYPLIIAGKPFNSYQAWIPVAFGLMVLFSAVGALLGMLVVNRLPRWHHDLFNSELFSTRANNDAFFISVATADKNFDDKATWALLEAAGAEHIEWVEAS